MALKIVEESDALLHLIVSGRLDNAGVNDVRDEFLELVTSRMKSTLVDLSEVDFMSSAGVHMLLNGALLLERNHAKMVLLRPQTFVEETLGALGLDRILAIVHEKGEATGLLKRAQPPAATRENELCLTLKNEIPELSRLNAEVHAFLDGEALTPRARYAVELVFEETLTNIIKYGYDDDDAHEICARLAIHPEHLVITLEDDGHEFDPISAPKADPLKRIEEGGVGGLGIHMVRAMADSMCYRRLDGKNILEIRINPHAS